MNDVLDRWLGETLGVVEMLEREVAENHLAIQQAMAEIRRREAHIEAVERNIAVIRRATCEVDSHAENARFEEQFDETFMIPEYDYREESEPAAHPMVYLDEESDTSNVHIMPVAAASGVGRLPPPPPSAARLHR